MTMKNDAKLEEELICCFKIDMKIMACLWPKCTIFDLKKYRGVMFGNTEYWCKIWRKTDFCFQKWHEELEKCSPEHLKVSKLGLWWDSFVQSWKCLSVRFTGELCVIRMKNGASCTNTSVLIVKTITHVDLLIILKKKLLGHNMGLQNIIIY